MALSFAEELEEALTENHDPYAVFESKLPPNLRRLLIQPGIAPLFSGNQRGWRKLESAMMRKLSELDGSVRGVKYHLLDRDLPESSCGLVRREWSDRLDGGNGCWIHHAR